MCVVSGSSKDPSLALGERKGSQDRQAQIRTEPAPLIAPFSESRLPGRDTGICPVAAEPQPPAERTSRRVGNCFLTVNLLRMVGHSLLREGWNLTLMASGPVSMAAEDLLPGLHPARWTFYSKPEERNQTQFQEQGVLKDGE